MRRLLLLASLLAVAPLGAQSPSSPPPAPDGRLLRESTDTLAMYLVQGTDTSEIGMAIDRLSRVTRDGRTLLLRVYRTQSAILGNGVDSLVDDAATLAPVRQASRGSSGIMQVEFGDGRARGLLRLPTGDSVVVDAALPAVVYQASSFDLVLRASPLDDGWRAEVPSWLTTSRAVSGMRAEVRGMEVVAGRECWRVEAEFTGMSVAFWIDRETRALCQQEMRPRAGMTFLFRRYADRRRRRDADADLR